VVRALTCGGPFTVDYHYEASELVLVGTFQETWKDGGEVFTEVTVEELFKGEADQVVILRRRASSRIAGGAEYHVPEGQRWLLFLPGQAEWPAPCSGSGRLDGVPGRRRETTEAWLDELREYANGNLSTLQEPWQFREGPDNRCSMRLVGVHDSSPEDSRNGFFMDVVFASSEANPFALFVAYLPRGLRYSNTSDSDQPVALIVDGEPIQLDPPRETLGAPRYWGLQASEAEFVLDRMASQGSGSVQVGFDGGFVEEVIQHRFSSVHKAFVKCRDH
jgi:hypothetical protein